MAFRLDGDEPAAAGEESRQACNDQAKLIC
jgi:hypothetical protein